MSDPLRHQAFPRGALIGAATLIAFALLAAASARLGDFGATRMPETSAVQVRALRFEDRSDGAVVVIDDTTNATAAVLVAGTNGFLRSVMRGLARERKARGIGQEPAFEVIRWADGRLSLEDPVTGRVVALEAFGPDNAAAFARLLSATEPVFATATRDLP
jgi:putative photosynthetic complex assembly protein